MKKSLIVAFLVLYSSTASAGWIQDVLDYLGCLWVSFVNFMYDLYVVVYRALREGLATIIESVSVPVGLDAVGAQWASIDPGVAYFLGVSGIPESLAILGAGMSFRLLRKLVTLGQW